MDSRNQPIDKTALCSLLKSAREDIGMSIDDLSEATGIWKTGLRRMEEGDPRTTISTIESCLVVLEARGVRFRYAGDVTTPSYSVPGKRPRRPAPPPKRMKRRLSFLPDGWQGEITRTKWGYSLSRDAAKS